MPSSSQAVRLWATQKESRDVLPTNNQVLHKVRFSIPRWPHRALQLLRPRMGSRQGVPSLRVCICSLCIIRKKSTERTSHPTSKLWAATTRLRAMISCLDKRCVHGLPVRNDRHVEAAVLSSEYARLTSIASVYGAYTGTSDPLVIASPTNTSVASPAARSTTIPMATETAS